MPEKIDAYGGGLVTEQGLRRMSRAGWALLLAWVCTLVVWGVLRPDPYAKGWMLVLEMMAAGRLVCIYEGVRMGFSKAYLFVQSGPQDAVMLFIVFPWVVRAYERAVRGRAIDRFLRRLTHVAGQHQQKLERFGTLGLFLFVFFPMTSTLVGGVVGYLLGMPVRLVVPAVLLGHVLSVACLMVFFDWLEPVIRSFNEGFAQYFAWILLAVIIVVGWLFSVLKRWLASRRGASAPAQPLEEADVGVDTPE